MNIGRALPVWRSLLYVPVNVERFVARAIQSSADAIQLDLEDSIAPAEKDHARRLVEQSAMRVHAGGADVIVRINRPLGLAIRDIEASVSPFVSALSIPKVESADHLRLLSESVAEAESRAGMTVGTTRFIAGIETPAAWFQMREIAAADPRVAAMLLGSEDFSTAVGMATSVENLFVPKQTLVIVAAAANVLPLGIVGSFTDYKDLHKFREMARRSRELGFRGSTCIHPSQVAILNEEFGPRSAELDTAREVIDRFEAALSQGRGAFGVNGSMIDLPIVERARMLIHWQERIEARRSAGTPMPAQAASGYDPV